ncbi:zinc-binding alcohol dehydrogenase family protein [Spirosoma luteolum]
MNAVGFKTSLPIDDPQSFLDVVIDTPTPTGRELLVQVQAVSVNPVDYKIRQNAAPNQVLDTPKIIGWDAVGTVVAVGSEVSLFAVGDAVYYAGDITKSGSYAEYQVIDERIVGRRPARLSIADAAAVPLTALTAWELFFDRMRLSAERDAGKTVLIIGGAGGVGSIAIQLAKKVLGLRVITTASRPETTDWCLQLGADQVVNHRALVDEIRALGIQQVDYIVDLVDNNAYWDSMVELIKPQGHIASITGSAQPVALTKLKGKSVTFSWELMFTRSSFQTDDMIEQHRILTKVAALYDTGVLVSTRQTQLNGLTAETFRQAHRQLESGTTIGKLVVVF